MRRRPYVEGDWFAIPIDEGCFAAGRIARVHATGRIVFAYLFGPFVQQPTLTDLEALSAEAAVMIGMVGDRGLMLGEWPVLGSGAWVRDAWPLMPFRNVDPITGKVRRVEYADSDLTMPVVWQVSEDEMTSAPQDTLYGHVSLQNHLRKRFA